VSIARVSSFFSPNYGVYNSLLIAARAFIIVTITAAVAAIAPTTATTSTTAATAITTPAAGGRIAKKEAMPVADQPDALVGVSLHQQNPPFILAIPHEEIGKGAGRFIERNGHGSFSSHTRWPKTGTHWVLTHRPEDQLIALVAG
jgi:hypothetical protein